MRRQLTAIFMSLFLSCAMATAALAEYVYVTKSGKRYHNAESRFIKNKDTEKITKEEAEERGLKPSSDYIKFHNSQNMNKKAKK